MLRPVEMCKVVVIGDKTMEENIIKSMQKLGLIHITKSKFPKLSEDNALPIYSKISDALVEVRSFLKMLEEEGLRPKDSIEPKFEDLNNVLSRVGKIREKSNEFAQLLNEKKQMEEQVKRIKEQIKALELLKPFSNLNFDKLKTAHFDYCLVLGKEKNIRQLKQELNDYLQKQVQFIEKPTKQGILLLIIFEKSSNSIDFILNKFNIPKISVPDSIGKVSEALNKLAEALNQAKKQLTQISKNMKKISDEFGKEAVELELLLSILAEQATISLKFQSSANIFICTGWVEKSKFENIKNALKDEFGSGVEVLRIKTNETPPVILRNPTIVKPFEYLATFLALPGKYDIDPSIFMFVMLPILYGMIVGDVGYAIISAALSYIIIHKFKNEMLVNVAKIWYYSSVAAAFWGVIFDEWFGMGHEELLKLLNSFGLPLPVHAFYHGISRTHNLTLVLGLTLIAGVIQLIFGFLLGAYVELKHNKKHALGKFAWALLTLAGSIAVATFLFNILPKSVGNLSILALPFLIIIIFWAEGLPGLFEIPGVAANALSYTRIAAAGVAGVIIAEVINNSLSPSPSLGIMNLVVFPVFLVLHAVNAALAMFESLVQAGRLNLVEFFTKFYHGGGKPFKPFSLRLRHKVR